MTDFNARIIEEFRTNSGIVGGPFEGHPLLLLHTDGAKSGTHYTTPVAYLPDGERYAIFASKNGAPTNPGWYHNLKANPDAQIEVGEQTIGVTAVEATGAERERLYGQQAAQVPQFAEYARKTDRLIPVIVLTPKLG